MTSGILVRIALYRGAIQCEAIDSIDLRSSTLPRDHHSQLGGMFKY